MIERKDIIRRGLLAGVFTVAAIGIGFAAKEAVDLVDSAFRPTYVNAGFSPPIPDGEPLWQPRTNWRVTYVDGRTAKK